ncbi:MAG: hypothetical protein ACREDJ_07830 [Methylocella sp.]
MADAIIIVNIGGSIENATTAVDQARASIESPSHLLQSAFGGIGAVAATLTADKIKGFAESMAELGT